MCLFKHHNQTKQRRCSAWPLKRKPEKTKFTLLRFNEPYNYTAETILKKMGKRPALLLVHMPINHSKWSFNRRFTFCTLILINFDISEYYNITIVVVVVWHAHASQFANCSSDSLWVLLCALVLDRNCKQWTKWWIIYWCVQIISLTLPPISSWTEFFRACGK